MADGDSASESSTYGSLTAEDERENGETEQDGDGHHRTVVISERQRRKYNGALRELYELAKLRKEEMETEESDDDGDDEIEDHKSGNGRSNAQYRLEDVHRELMEISRKLQMENERLFEQEMELRQREVNVEKVEKMVRESHSLLEKCAEQEVNKRWAQMAEKHQLEQGELEETIKQKTRENKRLKTSYETVRQANEALKQQLAVLQEKNQKLETQLVGVQRRVTNLQRKNEFAHRHQSTTETPAENSQSEPVPAAHKPVPLSAPVKSHKLMATPGIFEVIPLLFDWITAVHQRERDKDRLHQTQSAVFAQERCCKVLPRLSDLLPLLPSGNNKVHYPCLQFIFWCLMHVGEGGNQKMALSSTLRRIGEELYRPSHAVQFLLCRC
jgi:chromosome segregation ATPase